MQAYTKNEFLEQDVASLLLHKVFIYPTDTIYGIGCNALDEKLVQQVRQIKQRDSKPFSVIAPSKEWILEYCEVPSHAQQWLEKLPGAYTLVFRMKKELAPSLTMGKQTVGVRIPDHWISDVVAAHGVPIVTTSANLSGQPPITDAKQVELDVDFVIDEGELKGRPSTIVRLDTEKVEVIAR